MGRIDGNPGTTTRGRVGFAAGERSWLESFDVLEALATALSRSQHRFRRTESEIVLEDPSIVLIPGVVGGVDTPATCASIASPEMRRRVVLGPVTYCAERPADERAAEDADDHAPFARAAC
jgi:hypothetical protein